jgi:hypothetical protein
MNLRIRFRCFLLFDPELGLKYIINLGDSNLFA